MIALSRGQCSVYASLWQVLLLSSLSRSPGMDSVAQLEHQVCCFDAAASMG
jgi:hypothetical protein